MDEGIRDRELRVVKYLATRSGDTERGPAIWLNPEEARARLLAEGELAWVYGPRRHELAEVRVDGTMALGEIVLRDVAGVAPSEMVRVVKPDLDARGRRTAFA
jgi:anaerobic selenocysteine-containing dehydrogenase